MIDWPFGMLRSHAYGVILADPPWAFEGYTAAGVPQRAGDQHYGTMTHAELSALPVRRLARPDCALFMWSTSSHTPQAFALAEAWGFRFASKAFTWAKLNKNRGVEARAMDAASWFMGMGHGTRRQTEDCWLFTRGAPSRVGKGVRELIVAPIRDHSRKPDETHERIEALFPGPYAELFSREARAGWDSWGNETEKFRETG